MFTLSTDMDKVLINIFFKWLAVQDFWRYLEAVFSNPITAKELPQEFSRFARVDKSYMKMTKRAHDTKNVLQVAIPSIQPFFNRVECFNSYD